MGIISPNIDGRNRPSAKRQGVIKLGKIKSYDEQLKAKTQEFKDRLELAETLDDILPRLNWSRWYNQTILIFCTAGWRSLCGLHSGATV